MAERNDRLRQARQRVESPHASGDHLSRQELAELVNAWVHEHTGRIIELDANYVGKLEQGTIRWMRDAERRAAFRAVLGVRTDAELGLRRPRRTRTTVDDVDRQQFLRLGLGAGATVAGLGPSTIGDLLTPAEPTAVPSTVGMSHVADVRAVATAFRDWDARHGGELVREAAWTQLQNCARLLNARCADDVRTELFSAIGYLGQVTAFMALDAHAHDDARRAFLFARSTAEHAGDWPLRAKVLNSLASQAICRGDADAAVTFTELALVRADRLSAAERAMLHTVRGHGLGILGRVQEAARAVGVADEQFGQARPNVGPSWMNSYDTAHHLGETGRALWQASRHGHFTGEARRRLERAIDTYSAGAGRARMRSQVKLASLVMATGDPAEATDLGIHAMDTAAGVRSRRAVDDLRELRRRSEPHRRRADVAELCRRIDNAAAGQT